MNKIQTLKLGIIGISFLIVQICNAQKAPCYKKKKICDFKFLTNCYEKVAFDSITQRYYSRQNFGVPYDGSCATCHRNGVLEQEMTFVEGRRNGYIVLSIRMPLFKPKLFTWKPPWKKHNIL